MTATKETREVGHPWFSRHATRGAREIFAIDDGYVGENRIIGSTWRSADDMRDYYRRNQNDMKIHDTEHPGFLAARWFPTWEAAEEWLFAKDGDA